MQKVINILTARIKELNGAFDKAEKVLDEPELMTDYEFALNDIANIELDIIELQIAINILKDEKIKVKLFDPKKNKPIPSEDDPTFSVDVCIIDEENVHGLAFYSFDNEKWGFHTDTLVDYDEAENETKWCWYYPVVSATNVFEKNGGFLF